MALIRSPTSAVRTKVKGEARWKQEILKRKNEKLEKRRKNYHPLFPKGCVTGLFSSNFYSPADGLMKSRWFQYNTELMLKQCLCYSGWGKHTRVAVPSQRSTRQAPTLVKWVKDFNTAN
jgi:hypothetical protein